MKKTLKSTALAALLLPLLLIGEEGEEHIAVATRPQTEISLEDLKEEAAEVALVGEENEDRLTSGYGFDSYYSQAYHQVWEVAPFGNSVELRDGSVWKVNASETSKVENWLRNDQVIVTQNRDWFTSETYRLINQATGASVKVNLLLGPLKQGSDTVYVTSVDTWNGYVSLSDGTRFKVCKWDRSAFRDFALYDTVIRGFNSGWQSSYDVLLINVNMNTFVRAQLL